MKVVKNNKEKFIPVLSSTEAPEAKYFIDALRRLHKVEEKDLKQTTLFMENLIQKGLSHKIFHPAVRDLLSEMLMEGGELVVHQAFISALSSEKFSPRDCFFSAGIIYNHLGMSGCRNNPGVVRVMIAIKPFNWRSPEEHRSQQRKSA
jgi:hypothetical protein